jgi:hypothetical protein
VTSNASKKPWDQRLTERWAHQAKEAANDPTRRTVSWRDQVTSPWYWAALPAMGLFFVFGGFQGGGSSSIPFCTSESRAQAAAKLTDRSVGWSPIIELNVILGGLLFDLNFHDDLADVVGLNSELVDGAV